MKPGAHPREVLAYFLERFGPECTLEFSKYIYRPRSTVDDREYFTVGITEAAAAQEALAGSLNPEQDLALHSTLKQKNGETLHIPMLDLHGQFDSASVAPIADLMKVFGVESFAVFGSGRSAHVYGLGSLARDQIVPFLGRSLLLNLPDQPALVDSRWVGHRLIAGYGSLRWTCNSKQYLRLPELIEVYRVS